MISNDKIIDLLTMEYKELETGINTYSTKIFRILGGLISLVFAILWYGFQNVNSRGHLFILLSFIIHASSIYLIYCYFVYRTLKETKYIQSERINYFSPKKEILIWEIIWHEIWGKNIKEHTPLTNLFLILYFLGYVTLLFPFCYFGFDFLISQSFHLNRTWAYIYLSLMTALFILEVVLTRYYQNKLNNKFLKARGIWLSE